MTEYIPGVCNIGTAERRSRMVGGVAGLVFGVIILVVLFIIKAPSILRLFIFFPAFAATVGFLQSYFHFCAGFGMRGIYNVAKGLGQTDTVEQAEFRRKDMAKAFKIFLLSFVIALLVAILAFLLPAF